jgi:hypothetical protein
MNMLIEKYLGEMRDEDNPEFLFNMTSVKLLLQISNGRLDAVKLAKLALVNRGLDKSGKWIGHDEAKKFWKV